MQFQKRGQKSTQKVKFISEWPRLINIIGTRKFLSLLDYYRRVMKELSKIAFYLDQFVDKGYSV